MLVNNIAEICHTQVDQYNGHSNKNLGSSFLFIWKMIDFEVTFEGDIEQEIVDGNDVADMSIMAVYKCFAKLNAYKHMREFSAREDLQEAKPGSRIEMGWGMHLGWSIEGAIGS